MFDVYARYAIEQSGRLYWDGWSSDHILPRFVVLLHHHIDLLVLYRNDLGGVRVQFDAGEEGGRLSVSGWLGGLGLFDEGEGVLVEGVVGR